MTDRIRRAWRASERVVRERALSMVITLIVVALSALVLWPFVVTTVNSGQSAVLFRRFSGVELNRVYDEGLHLHWPWNTFFVYDLRMQTERRSIDVLANNGLTVKLEIAVRYHADYRRLPLLHRTIGPDYLERVVIPQTVAAVRGEAGKYSPEELYNTRQGLLDRATLQAIDEAAQRYVLVDAVLFEAVTLPPVIQAAIEEKLKYEQAAKAYEFRLDLERREAERKQIEATGIRNYNATVSETLREPLIRWQGVQASKELATSNNAKIVLFGGQGQLPVILGGMDTSSPQPATVGGAGRSGAGK